MTSRVSDTGYLDMTEAEWFQDILEAKQEKGDPFFSDEQIAFLTKAREGENKLSFYKISVIWAKYWPAIHQNTINRRWSEYKDGLRKPISETK